MAGRRATGGRKSGTSRRASVWLVLTPLVIGPLAACSDGAATGGPRPPKVVDAAHLMHTSPVADADSTKPFTVTADAGDAVTDVTLTGPDGRQVAGALTADGGSWQSTGTLLPGTSYTARIAASNGHGGRGEATLTVSTKAADQLLTAELGPNLGQGTYGVGEPLTVKLSTEVKDPAARQRVESALTVVSEPAVTGAWYWVDGKELHFRPKDYWPANATVRLGYDAEGRRIDGGLFGGAPANLSFKTGDRIEAIVDAASDEMTYKRNGEVVASFPVTTGKPGFDTRNGIKVVLGQERVVQMSSETIGIAKGSSESYDLKVEWATRVTWSGEYVHAAPWSVASQGVENVSHGCTGMSTDNAEWFYEHTRVGDLVQVVNSHGHEMEPFGNGFGDWNVDWNDWVKGSALGKPVSTQGPAQLPQAAATLHPEV
ncbi:Ig-like domain-containing protein [Kitasatospora sp. LaBMicrA B282]|uniref:L,D-transpeptidase n=1 Tax=Kitasatospora sp. LaBMicrA B282 TaxID=3420949 RepID=UPI003D0B36F2